MLTRIIYLFWLLVAALSITGCQRDETDPEVSGDNVSLTLRLGTYGTDDPYATEDECRIKEAYVFIYSSGGLLENKGNTGVRAATDGNLVDASGRLNGTWKVKPGSKTIRVVLNPHRIGLSTPYAVSPTPPLVDLSSWNTENLLDWSMLINYSEDFKLYYSEEKDFNRSAGLLMTGVVNNVTLKNIHTQDVTIPIQRCYARIDLRMRKSEAMKDTPVTLTWGSGICWYLQDVAFQGRLFDDPTAVRVLANSELGYSVLRDAAKRPTSITSTDEYQYLGSFYVMPFPYNRQSSRKGVTGPSGEAAWGRATLRIITDISVNGQSVEEYKIIPLTEYDVDHKPILSKPLDIQPNKIYNLNTTLTPHSTDVEIKIKDWNDVSISGDIPGTTLSVSKSNVVMDWWNLGKRFDTSVDYSSDGTVSLVGFTWVVGGGAEIFTEDGSRLPTWLPRGNITGLPDGTTMSGKIGLKYVVTDEILQSSISSYDDVILHLKTGNITKDIRIVCDNGFIPNSFLKAQGWEENVLPGLGIQLAKRGNKLPEVAMADAADPQMFWVNIDVVDWISQGVGDYGLGPILTTRVLEAYGKDGGSSAAAHCRALGSEWYMMSDSELLNLYKNRSCLSNESYSLKNAGQYVNNAYWSITDMDEQSANLLNFDTGTVYARHKIYDTQLYVRCVRNVSDIQLSKTELAADWYNWGQSFTTNVICTSSSAVSIRSIDNQGSDKNWLKSAVVSGSTISVTYQPTASNIHNDVKIVVQTAAGETATITVKYNNGFIPREQLVTSGWDLSDAPSKGIQIAKVGNQRPDKNATTDGAELFPWGPTMYIDGSDYFYNGAYGKGLFLTTLLISKFGSSGMGTAAYQCSNVINGVNDQNWYLPQMQEFGPLFQNNLYLSPSYRFGDYSYWTCMPTTNNDKAYSMSNSTSFIRKLRSENQNVRCVRNF